MFPIIPLTKPSSAFISVSPFTIWATIFKLTLKQSSILMKNIKITCPFKYTITIHPISIETSFIGTSSSPFHLPLSTHLILIPFPYVSFTILPALSALSMSLIIDPCTRICRSIRPLITTISLLDTLKKFSLII